MIKDKYKTKMQLTNELERMRQMIATWETCEISHKQAEEKIKRHYHIQNTTSSILRIALEPISLEEQLDRTLDLILSIPWLSLQSKGCIFLAEDEPEILVMKAQRGLHKSLLTACEKVPFGRCLCGMAASTRNIQFTDCVDDRHKTQYQGILPHGHYCVPIISGERVLGVANLYVKEGHKREQIEEDFLSAVANTLAGIIERKQAEERIRRDYHIQSVTSSILRISLEPISMEEQLDRTLDLILSIPWLSLQSKGCIFLVEDEPDALAMKVQRGLAEPLLTACAKVPFGRCLCGRAASTCEIQFSDHVDDRHETHYQGILPHGHYNVPIVSGDRVLGVINLYVKEGHKREQIEEEFLTAVANALAGIIKRKQAEEERIEMQEKLIRSEKLAAVGKVAGGIGHDLRNPLNIIENSTSYISEILKDEDEQVRKQLDIIHRAVKRSSNIVTDLLDFARAKPLSLEKCNVRDTVKEALSNIEIPKNITVETHMDEGVPEIFTDANQIQRVFLNLISNAFRAMPEGGSLTITSRVNTVFSKDSGAVEIEFKDSGVGIKENNLNKIFEPLFTTRSKGIGLGMAIVKDIIDKHHGTIDVQSVVGKGTTFTVRLPVKI